MNFSFKDFKFDGGKIDVKNVFDPLIKQGMNTLVIFVFLFLLTSFLLKDTIFAYFAMALVGLYYLFSFGMYLFYSVKDPSRLQSESFVIELKKIDLKKMQKKEKDITSESKLEISGDGHSTVLAVQYDEKNDSGEHE